MKKMLLAIFLVLTLVSSSWAYNSYLRAFNDQYGTAGSKLDSCSTCHVQGHNLNAYGEDFLKALDVDGATESSALLAIDHLDSDGDGAFNALEISAGTFPGDAKDQPSVPVESQTWSSIKSKFR